MENQQTKSNNDRIATISLCLGVASIFLWKFWIISILVIILGIESLICKKTKWKAIAAIILGIISLLVGIYRVEVSTPNSFNKAGTLPTMPIKDKSASQAITENSKEECLHTNMVQFSTTEESRMKEIILSVMQGNADTLTPVIYNEFWSIMNRHGKLCEEDIASTKDSFAAATACTKLFYLDALQSLNTGRVYKSVQRLDCENKTILALLPADKAATRIKANDELMFKIASKQPVDTATDNVIFTKEMIESTLVDMNAKLERFDKLFTQNSPPTSASVNSQNGQSPEVIEKEQATSQEDAPDLTEEEIYKNPFVTHIRVALNGYLDGSNAGIEDSSVIDGMENSGLDCGLSKYDKSYFKSKFIVWSSETNKYGGRSTYIIFIDKPDTIFWAWVYKIDTDEYVLRSFCASGPKEEDRAKFPEMIKAMLKDGKFPYSL